MKKNKDFLTKIKQLNKEHKPGDVKPAVNKQWKKEWGSFIKYDQDWDGAYLLDLIIYKLEKMYFALDIYSNEVREDLDPKLAVLKETIQLGKKLQTYDYNKESFRFSEEHCAQIVYIYDREGKSESDPLSSMKLLAKVARSKFNIDNLSDLFGSALADQWIKEHGYTKEQVLYAYGGEWDDPNNQKAYIKMVKQEAKNEDKDTVKFFTMIAKNYRGWWW